MNANNVLRICGSIIKKESLVPFTGPVMDHTFVAEGNRPYFDYYGMINHQLQPHSLFLFTDRYYTLEEVLRFTQNIGICAENKVNAGSAIIDYNGERHPAVRIRNFPDYQHIIHLQECFSKLGMKFSRRFNLQAEGIISVNKCFHIQEKGDGFYLDLDNPNEGYFTIPHYPDNEEFESLVRYIRNNSSCPLFDAAYGGFIMEGKVFFIMRIYSGHLDLDMLSCIRKAALKWTGRQYEAETVI